MPAPPLRGSVAQAPLLVCAAVAAPELDPRTVGGPETAGINTETRLHHGDRAIGVEVPLLICPTVAVPYDHGGAVAGALAVRVQALVAVHHQLPAGSIGPALVGTAVTVPQLQLRAVRRAG